VNRIASLWHPNISQQTSFAKYTQQRTPGLMEMRSRFSVFVSQTSLYKSFRLSDNILKIYPYQQDPKKTGSQSFFKALYQLRQNLKSNRYSYKRI